VYRAQSGLLVRKAPLAGDAGGFTIPINTACKQK
jgi:hypothetical protein